MILGLNVQRLRSRPQGEMEQKELIQVIAHRFSTSFVSSALTFLFSSSLQAVHFR